MKKPRTISRSQGFNRFQTSVPGLTWVPTSMDAHFDPYQEPAVPNARPARDMEPVARIPVTPPAPPRRA